ncbi:hypothetical protein M436DRAFT_66127 [Aureobasidium namibiae CBS 147.97]|uniref:Uncharacterized protein n=1 Tax=Aureobasidium namibiae CBS 147.97 TaxID=1043004 RepID=A0A074WCQ3_9PEZI|nr:uncharacterized protein M436DRAFT_66127 [Aureobasidium namibiae CBS 147.97]KEQ70723.1 hypothetical protein M436DRAFT_66127 [Aureobasidium namibiae CBS 147.97]
MRQRGAGARSIPTNFGFVFHAGPIQVADTSTTEPPVPANTTTIAIAQTEPHHVPAPSFPAHAPATKRKRLVKEEEDDRAWFQKRKRKSAKHEDSEHDLPAATTKVAVDESHQEPPVELKPAKRKVRKRVLVPRPRKKAPIEPQPEPLRKEPTPLSEVAPEIHPPAKKKTKSKAPVAKREPKVPHTPDAPLSAHEQAQEHEPSNPSPHTITELAPLKKAKSTHRPDDEDKKDNRPAENTLERESHRNTVATLVQEQPGQPPKKKKMVRRVRVPKVSTRRAVPTTDDSSVKTTDMQDAKPSTSSDDAQLSLFEAVAPALTTKKASKAPKKIFFNDDSDIDLDQMLSGIAAMAETKTTTKVATSKSRRVTRKKIAS